MTGVTVNVTLPPELARAAKLHHRSPTYVFTLIDGRGLHVRREAHAFTKKGETDRNVLAEGGGEVVWWVQCGNSVTSAPRLGDALLKAIGIPDMDANFEAFWIGMRDIMGIALGLAEDAVPCEVQT